MNSQPLSEKQTLILQNFISQFLPQSGNERKYTHNQFSYIYSTISKIFYKNLNVKISEMDMVLALGHLKYVFFVSEITNRESTFKKNPGNRKRMPKTPFLDFPENALIHINISSKTIMEVKKASNSIAYQKNPLKIAQILPLKEKITNFFKLADKE